MARAGVWFPSHRRRRHQRFQAGQQQFELFGIQTFILGAAEVTFEKQFQLLAEQFVFNGQLGEGLLILLPGRVQRAAQRGHQLA